MHRFLIPFLMWSALAASATPASAAYVTLDTLDLLPEEEFQVERLAGGVVFEILVDENEESSTGLHDEWLIVDDLEVTSRDEQTFVLYVTNEEGDGWILDIEVMESGSLSVYNPTSDAIELWRAADSEDSDVDQAESYSDGIASARSSGAEGPNQRIDPMSDEELLAQFMALNATNPNDDTETEAEIREALEQQRQEALEQAEEQAEEQAAEKDEADG